MTINILHITEGMTSSEISEFVHKNVHSIDIVTVEIQEFLQSLNDSGLLIIKPFGGIEDLISIRKMSNRLFNNNYFKDNSPISSPEFVCEISGEMDAQGITESWLSMLYHYNVPVFIRSVDVANHIFGGSFESTAPLLSSEVDFDLYNTIIKKYPMYKILALDSYEDRLLDMYELASMGHGFNKYFMVTPKSELENTNNDFDYDVMTRDMLNG
jgi:hypothetical protein